MEIIETSIKEHEMGIKFNDSHLNINWHIDQNDIILSSKDKELELFKS